MRKRGSLCRRAAAIMLVLAMLFGMTGCRLFRKSKAEQAVEYMNAKYDDEFTFKSYASGDSRSYVFLSSKKFPDANIQVNGDKQKDGSYQFWDNYLYCKYENQTRDFFKKFLEEVFQCEVYVDYDLGYGLIPKDDLNSETTFDEFIHSTTYGIVFTALVSDKCKFKKDDIESRLKNAIIGENINITLMICDFAATSTDYECGKNGEDYETKDTLHVIMKEKSKFDEFEWVK